MMKNYKYYFLFFIFLITSCQHRKFSIEDITIPSYYKSYDYKSYWKSRGYTFPFYDPAITKQNNYKDKESRNFMSININNSSIINLDKSIRLTEFTNYAKELDGVLEHGLKNNIEYYTITYQHKLGEQLMYNSDTHLFFVKDKIHLTINFTSFDNPGKKEDYVELVDDVLNYGK